MHATRAYPYAPKSPQPWSSRNLFPFCFRRCVLHAVFGQGCYTPMSSSSIVRYECVSGLEILCRPNMHLFGIPEVQCLRVSASSIWFTDGRTSPIMSSGGVCLAGIEAVALYRGVIGSCRLRCMYYCARSRSGWSILSDSKRLSRSALRELTGQLLLRLQSIRTLLHGYAILRLRARRSLCPGRVMARE